MAAIITATRTSTLFQDFDLDGVFDPGDIILTRIRISNTGDAPAGNITVEDTLSGVTMVVGSVQVTPIAFDDNFSITGNTPITLTAAQIRGNDDDPDGAEANLRITEINGTTVVAGDGVTPISVTIAVTNGSVTSNLDGSFTFTPTVGLDVNATGSFTYTVTDEQGLESVDLTPGKVTLTITDVVWYVDNTYGGGDSDGSYLKPFTSLTPLNNSGADADAAGETIFVFHNGGNYSAGITLEAGQKLLGDGQAFMANNLNIGGTSRTTGNDTVATNAVISLGTGTGVVLATDNTVKGLTLDSAGAAAIGMTDGGTSVTSATAGAKLLVSGVTFTGTGQAIDIDAGGNLDVTIESITSTGSTAQGVQLAGTAASGTGLLSGTFTVTSGGNIAGSASHNFQIGGNGPSSGGTLAVSYGGTLNGSPAGSLVNISDRIAGAGDISFSGALSQTAVAPTSAAIFLANIAAGNINLTGAKTISLTGGSANAVTVSSQSGGAINLTGGNIDIDFATGTTGHAFAFANQTGGTVAVSTTAGSIDVDFAGTASGAGISVTNSGTAGGSVGFSGNGLTITTQSGDGINVNNTTQGTGQLNISGTGNTITTNTGQIVDILNSNTTGMSFATLNSGVAVGNAIGINNLDGGGTFSGGNVDVNGGSGDGINLSNSATTFTFASATIDNVAGDGIEVNGAGSTQNAVTFTTVDIDGPSANGVLIQSATNAVTISGGTIGTGGAAGAANDPGSDGVNINGGTGAVTIAANITKNSAGGFEVVDISSHGTGAISFSGDINSSGGSGGIRLVNNSSGNITFSGANVQLSTGTLAGLTYTNGAATGGTNVTFTGGNFDITTTSGTGINATNGTAGASTLGISGAGNTVTATTGRAITLDGVSSSGITLLSVAKSGGSETGIYLNNAGTGGFTVTGTGSTGGSGGTLQNITGTNGQNTSGIGLYANNTDNISLSNMNFTGPMNNYAIKGNNVTNFTLRDSTISGAMGNDDVTENEAAIWFTNLDGVGLFEGNNIAGGWTDNLRIETNTGTLHLFVRDSASDQAVFGHNSTTTFANDSIFVEMAGNSNLFAVIDGVQFTGWRGDGVAIQTIGTANSEITIKNSSFVNGHGMIASAGGIGVLIDGTGGGAGWSVDYTIQDNTFSGSKGYALAASFVGTSGKIRGYIEGNTIGTPGGGQQTSGPTTGSSEAGGMFLSVEKVGGSAGVLEHYVTVEGNIIRDVAKYGIYVRSTNGGSAPANYAVTEATIKNNNIDEMFGPGVAALRALAGGADPDFGRVGLDLQNNVFNADTSSDSYGAVFLDQIFNTGALYYLPGYAGDLAGESYGVGNASVDVTNYLTGRGNTLTPSTTANVAPFSAGVYAADAKLSGAALTQPAPTGSDTQLPSGAMLFEPQPLVAVPDPAPSEEPQTGGGDSGDSGGTGDSGDSGGTGDSGTPTPPPPATPAGDDGVLTAAELALLVEAAIQRWIDAGASAEQIAAMRAVDVGLVDMSGVYVGSARPGTISIDGDGAGYGWFVDTSPNEDSEFEGSGTRLTADVGGAAEGKVDLLTVLMHELGHQIGLGDDYNANNDDSLMYGYAHISERRLPAEGDAAHGTPGVVHNEAFAVIPATITSLPANKMVDVFFRSTINFQEDKAISPLMNTATIKVGGVTVTTAVENNALDSLTLGSTIYHDANRNNQFDAGEGVSGVALQLYADTNNSGGWDAGDVLVTTGSSGALGAYSFAGLAPGDYIVVVTAANFNSGQPLFGRYSGPGVADPDDNVDNDDNGMAGVTGLGVAVASQTITLSYNNEPTAGVGNDTNNTLDFGFLTNVAPVAVDDAATIDEDSIDNVIAVLGNDTDADAGDTLTVTAVTNPVNGTVSLVGGVVKFTPTANFNGTAGFDYTVDDGNGHTDTGHVTVTVTAVNDAVTGTAPATASLNEDAANVAITGMSISDVDATLAPAGVYDVTLSATNGTLTLTTTTGLTFGTGDGSGDTTMTFHGTLAAINTALATAQYTPTAGYNGSAQISLQVTDTYGGIVATGTGAATNDTDNIAVTVNSVNDQPVGTDDSAAPVEGVTYVFLTTDFSDGFSDPNDSPANTFAGVKITTLPATGTIKLNGTAILAGAEITKAQLDNGELTFDAAPASAGTSPTFTFQVRDNGTTANGGVDYDQTPNTFTLNIGSANAVPTVDLDADDSVAVGTGFASAYTEGGAAAAISDIDVDITDADVGDDIVSATITITNPETGDKLNVGALPGTVTLDGTSTDTMVKLTAAAGTSAADFEAAIEAITFSSSSDDPTDKGTNVSRSITVVVNDGTSNSAAATATVAVTDVNDLPTGTSATITAVEDTFRLLAGADFGIVDVDGVLGSVTISAVSGGGIYLDADGTAGGGGFVLETLPKTYTAQDFIDGKVAFMAGPNVNGSAIGTITFTVADDDGASAAASNVLTVDVSAVNDQPNIPNSPTINTTEQVLIKINTALTVSDADLDARNGGAGDYSGASFAINRDVSNADDFFGFETAGALFTVDGNDIEVGGVVIATFTQSGGILNVNFVNNGTVPTTALVNDVLQHLRYTNFSDNPPASVTLLYVFNDGAPGGGQGTVTASNNIDGGQVIVNIAAVNDAPVNSLGGTIGTGEDAIDAWLSGMSISDPDANPATDDIVVTFQVNFGTLDIRTDVGGGVTAGDVTGDDTGTITVTATLNQINATLLASNGLTYTPNPNFSSNDTLTVTTNDQGANGSGGSKTTVSTRTITVSPQPDAPVAQPDSATTPETTAVDTPNLLTNDNDADGDTLSISAVIGGTLGVPFALPSGAILTVNANGTYVYDPNGKFNTLTNTSGGEIGAVNTSATDSFQYTVSGGNTVTVTVTITGVANDFDWLAGDGTDNTISGTPGDDFFVVTQGGNDDLSGLGGNDVFYFGGAMTSADEVDGGDGAAIDVDQIALQGNYSGGLTFGPNVVDVENLAIMPGNDTRFGDPGTNFYDYNLTLLDVNVAAGLQMIIDANRLRVGEDFTFNGTAETDGSFFIYGGGGTDNLTGGANDDVFLFGAQGQWGASDVVNGGPGVGVDQLALRGDYTVTFGAGQLVGIEQIGMVSAFDTRYGALGDTYDYNLTMNDGNVVGIQMIVDAAPLRSNETLTFNGSAEDDGSFKVFGGQGNDTITGSQTADVIVGNLGGDVMTGGLGSDKFVYRSKDDSPAGGNRDGIQDFTTGDLLDLSLVDAIDGGANDAFTFIGTAAFTFGVAGQLRAVVSSGPIWLVQGDTNGDAVADLEFFVTVTDASPINSADFIL